MHAADLALVDEVVEPGRLCDWLEPGLREIPGQDPLGLQTITTDRILPSLLPGVLALSVRARYFSIYAFLLEVTPSSNESSVRESDLEHTRVIPTPVKLEVWARDQGRCVECGSSDNLHFDHVIPYSRGGSSLVADNIQLLCARHNLSKGGRLR